jgi:hypothetical protein
MEGGTATMEGLKRLIVPTSKGSNTYRVWSVPNDYEMTREERIAGATIETPGAGKTTGWVQTSTGLPFWPLEPDWWLIDISDIAHHLAQRVRYSGACSELYSVAQHSYLMAKWGQRKGLSSREQMQLLLHDAAEYVLPDVPRPIKKALEGFAGIEGRVETEIVSWFNKVYGHRLRLPWPFEPVVKYADDRILRNEKDAFMQPEPLPWGIAEVGLPIEAIEALPWKEAKMKFLQAFNKILCGRPIE